jgi:hypothetical protein
MPLYSFDIGNEGAGTVQELPDDAAAISMARDTFAQMIGDDQTGANLRMRVRDQTGREIVSLSFAARTPAN